LIANAGQLGLNWRELDLSSYLEAMEAHSAANDPNAAKEPRAPTDVNRLRKFHSAHKAAGSLAAGKQ